MLQICVRYHFSPSTHNSPWIWVQYLGDIMASSSAFLSHFLQTLAYSKLATLFYSTCSFSSYYSCFSYSSNSYYSYYSSSFDFHYFFRSPAQNTMAPSLEPRTEAYHRMDTGIFEGYKPYLQPKTVPVWLSAFGTTAVIPTAVVIKGIPFHARAKELAEILTRATLPAPWLLNYLFGGGRFRG
jgi:hypothetical protein